MGGILPPILGRKDFGGPGEAGEKGGSGRGSAAPSVVVVCLSVAMRTSPSCLGRSQQNFRWGSGSWSGTFISGTGPIGQGSGEKRAGNLNFIDGDTAELAVFLPCDGRYELPGVTRCCQAVARCSLEVASHGQVLCRKGGKFEFQTYCRFTGGCFWSKKWL